MGLMSDGSRTSVNNVVINLHSGPTSLWSNMDYDDRSNIINISNLETQTMDGLFLATCNSGLIDHSENLATMFLENQNIGFVIAPDGYHRRHHPVGESLSVSSNITSTDGKNTRALSDREGNGFVLYQEVDGEIQVFADGIRLDGERVNSVGTLFGSARQLANMRPAWLRRLMGFRPFTEEYMEDFINLIIEEEKLQVNSNSLISHKT